MFETLTLERDGRQGVIKRNVIVNSLHNALMTFVELKYLEGSSVPIVY
jgi:hypothetical protein